MATADSLLAQVQALDLKQMDALLLAADVRSRSASAGFDTARVDEAIVTAAWAHREHRRLERGDLPRTAYIEHPLRNAARVLRWGVVSEPIVIACLLHDTVEDAALELAELFTGATPTAEGLAREVVLNTYGTTFGHRVSELVRAMSNPLADAEPRHESDAHRAYRAHVVEAVADPDVAVCKLADLTDNALSLHHTGSPDDPRTARLARKYAPLLPVMWERIQAADVRGILSPDGHRAASDALEAGVARLTAMTAGG